MANIISKTLRGLSNIFSPINKAREKVAELKKLEAETLAAPITSTEARSRLRNYLQNQAAHLESELRFIAPGLTDRCSSPYDVIYTINLRRLSVFDFALFLFGPEVIEQRLMATVGADSETGALSEADYSKRLKEITKSIRQAETEEEHLIREVEENGVDIARRPDADPAVVLGS